MRLNYIDNIDCLEGLAAVPDKSVDTIITDPPYFLSMGHDRNEPARHGGPDADTKKDYTVLGTRRTCTAAVLVPVRAERAGRTTN